jgi:hypothetical protein
MHRERWLSAGRFMVCIVRYISIGADRQAFAKEAAAGGAGEVDCEFPGLRAPGDVVAVVVHPDGDRPLDPPFDLRREHPAVVREEGIFPLHVAEALVRLPGKALEVDHGGDFPAVSGGDGLFEMLKERAERPVCSRGTVRCRAGAQGGAYQDRE